jgi:hypothetical protein
MSHYELPVSLSELGQQNAERTIGRRAAVMNVMGEEMLNCAIYMLVIGP